MKALLYLPTSCESTWLSKFSKSVGVADLSPPGNPVRPEKTKTASRHFRDAVVMYLPRRRASDRETIRNCQFLSYSSQDISIPHNPELSRDYIYIINHFFCQEKSFKRKPKPRMLLQFSASEIVVKGLFRIEPQHKWIN